MREEKALKMSHNDHSWGSHALSVWKGNLENSGELNRHGLLPLWNCLTTANIDINVSEVQLGGMQYQL